MTKQPFQSQAAGQSPSDGKVDQSLRISEVNQRQPNVITSKKRKTSFHLLLADLKSSQVAHFESPAPTFPGIPPPPPLLLHSLLLSTIFYIIILSSVSTSLLSLGIILLVFIIGSRSKQIVVKNGTFLSELFSRTALGNADVLSQYLQVRVASRIGFYSVSYRR